MVNNLPLVLLLSVVQTRYPVFVTQKNRRAGFLTLARHTQPLFSNDAIMLATDPPLISFDER